MAHDTAPKPAFRRKVVRVTRNWTLVHFFLECGHLVTEHKNDFPGTLPGSLKCWACEASDQKKSA